MHALRSQAHPSRSPMHAHRSQAHEGRAPAGKENRHGHAVQALGRGGSLQRRGSLTVSRIHILRATLRSTAQAQEAYRRAETAMANIWRTLADLESRAQSTLKLAKRTDCTYPAP